MFATRWLTGPLALFDLALGATALAFPEFYMKLLHGGGSHFLLQRTGVLWLFFAAAEIAAFARPRRETVGLVAMLRLMDVPADAVYFFTSPSLTWFGRWSLIVSPVFNACAGIWLFRRSYFWKSSAV